MAEAGGMVIVGGGKAGARAAIGFRENGFAGTVTIVSDEVLLPYDRPPLSKAAISGETDPEPTYLLDADMMASLKVRFVGGAAATAIDRTAKTLSLSNGDALFYDKLLVATGAAPRKLSLAGAQRALDLRDLGDAVVIRSSFSPGKDVAIIGGGFIGLELAASAVKRGCRVTVIEAQPRILMRGVPEEISSVIMARHADAGNTILTNTGISQIESDCIVLADGRRIAADVVVAGIGAAPRIELAAQAGLQLENGIFCDAGMRTSDPDIFAVGDCCSFPHPTFDGMRLRLEAWRNASDQAVIAVENMLGGSRVYEAIPWFWSDQFDLTLQIAGMPSLGISRVTRPLRDGAFILCHLAGDGRLVGASGIGPGNLIARDVRLLEMLIGKRAYPDAVLLADGSSQLKALLKA